MSISVHELATSSTASKKSTTESDINSLLKSIDEIFTEYKTQWKLLYENSLSLEQHSIDLLDTFKSLSELNSLILLNKDFSAIPKTIVSQIFTVWYKDLNNKIEQILPKIESNPSSDFCETFYKQFEDKLKNILIKVDVLRVSVSKDKVIPVSFLIKSDDPEVLKNKAKLIDDTSEKGYYQVTNRVFALLWHAHCKLQFLCENIKRMYPTFECFRKILTDNINYLEKSSRNSGAATDKNPGIDPNATSSVGKQPPDKHIHLTVSMFGNNEQEMQQKSQKEEGKRKADYSYRAQLSAHLEKIKMENKQKRLDREAAVEQARKEAEIAKQKLREAFAKEQEIKQARELALAQEQERQRLTAQTRQSVCL